MTQDDIEAGNSEASVFNTDVATSTAGVVEQWNVVNINAGIVEDQWDLAVASAADALVLIRWLDAKRST
jgi:hypothetical protein